MGSPVEGTKRQRGEERDGEINGQGDKQDVADAGRVDPLAVGVDDDDGADDAFVGPAAPVPKKRKVLEFEQTYLKALPLSEMYEGSYMHRDTVTHVAIAQATDFFITGSVDGHVKFWKKQPQGIEFVKHFRAHLGPVTGMVVSNDGTLCASLSSDKTVKVFDVINFDMIAMLRLPFVPSCAEWMYKKGEAKAKLAIAEATSPMIHLYDMRSGTDEEIHSFKVHSAPVTVMRYNAPKDVVMSADEKGVIDYWSASDFSFPSDVVTFDMKLDTDLYCMAKAKTAVKSLEVSPDGEQFVTMSTDWRVRVFRFSTGKLRRTFDESIAAANELQKSESEMFRLEPIDFGRRMAVEKELHEDAEAPFPNALFDESGNFVLYPTLLGIKVVNLVTNRVVKVIGKVENTERFLRIALYQGVPKKNKLKIVNADSKVVERDPTLLCCAHRKQRLFLFSRREPVDAEDATTGRDVFNEKPTGDEYLASDAGPSAASAVLPRGAILHTTRGDIFLKLFPDDCPKTVENFATHAKNGYYDTVIFHRVIKGFMVQTGDPMGDGTGGESIWGGEFEDEFSRNLRHDRPFTLSMANAGPNTNGSQFFITTVATPWLDNKHTVFGRVVKGADVVLAIEKAKTDRYDKPLEDIKIMNIDVKTVVE